VSVSPYMTPTANDMRRFLLAKLHIDFVCEARGETDVETDLSAIEKITCDNRSDDDHHINDVLNKAYHRNITRITKQSDRRNRRDAKHTLAFMRDAVRPLAMQELLQLLSVHVSEQTTRLDSAPLWSTVQHFCQGLIEKNESGIVQYLHQTLRCYLKSPDGLDLLPRLDEELGKRCVAYLTFDFCPTGVCRDTESFEMRLQQWPLLEYAARYWQIHMARFEQAKAGKISDRDYQAGSLHATALQFLGKDLHVESTFQIRSLPDRRLERSSRPDLRISSIRLLLVIEVKKVKQQLFVPNQTAGIHAACLFGLSTLVDRLIKGPRSESLDRRDSNGRYPLHFATEGNCADLVEDLIKAGADPNCRDASGVTPLILAQATGCDRVATVFTKLGDIVDINAQTKHMPKHTIYRSEVELFRQESGLARSTVVQSLVGVGGRTALHHAARSGDVPRLRDLLQDKRLNKELRDSEGNTALHKAAKKGHLEAFKVLIAAGADLDKTIDCPGDDWHENTCLHLASMYKRCNAVVRCILDLQPSRCNAVNAAGQSPLHLAATFNQTSHVRHLLAQDAIQVNLPDIEGFTPLHYATPNKSPLVMMMLLQRKDIRVNIQSKRGQSPLHLAASYGQAENVKTLLNQEGIKVNLLDEDGCSPLFEAARSGWRYAFVMLWEHPETDRDLRNARGETILETLEMDTDARKPHRVVLDILKHYRAHLAAIEDATDGLDDGVPDMPDPVKCTCRRALTSKYGLTELETRD
jgi:ankyrin repeat protein